jgi:hypothetical protein
LSYSFSDLLNRASPGIGKIPSLCLVNKVFNSHAS